MFRQFAITLGLVALMGCTTAPHQPGTELLGLELGDGVTEVAAALEGIATLDNELSGVAGRKQVWEVHEGPFHQLMVRYGGEQRVEYATAWIRDGEAALGVEEIGDPSLATVVEGQQWRWRLPQPDGRVVAVTARADLEGRPHTLSLHWAVVPGEDGVARRGGR